MEKNETNQQDQQSEGDQGTDELLNSDNLQSSVTELHFDQEQKIDQKVARPIKLKMIVAFGMVLSISISIFLYYSLDLFFTDKEAYIFESGLTHVQSLRSHIEESTTNFSQKISVFSYLSKSAPEEFSKIVNSQKELLAFYTLSESGTLINAAISKNVDTDLKSKIESPDIFDLFPQLKSSEENKFFMYPAHMLTQSETVLMGIKASNQIFAGIISFANITKLIKENKIFDSMVLDYSGTRFDNITKNIQKTPLLEKALELKFNSGTFQTNLSSNNNEVKTEDQQFVSFSKIPELGIIITATISKQKAFGAAYRMIKKTVGYGLILLGFALGIAVLLALNLTTPLKKLLEQTNYVSKGEFDKVQAIESSDEIGVLGRSIEHMSKQIVELLDSKQEIIDELVNAKFQLQEYSGNLEKLVEERTSELKESNSFINTMINSLDEGLFVIDKNGNCMESYTHSCIALFGQKLEKNNFFNLLNFEPDTEKYKTVQKWLKIVFEGGLDFESMKGLAPTQHAHTNAEGETISIKLNYFKMLDEFDELSNIVVVAKDVSTEVAAKEESKKKESEVDMILKILQSRKNFINFVESSRSIIKDLVNELDRNTLDLEKIKMGLHTLKGGFGQYSVAPIHDYTHFLESEIEDNSNSIQFRNEWIEFFEPRFKKLEDEFSIFLGTASKIIGFNLNEKTSYQRISSNQLKEFSFEIINTGNEKLFAKFRYEFMFSPISEHFRQYFDLTQIMAQKLGKKIKPLNFTNPSLRIDDEELRNFLGSLVHIFRNIVDHAIEYPEERKRIKKEQEGLITIDARIVQREEKPHLRLSITDDGKGIDPRMIRERIIKKDLPIEQEGVPDEELIYAIFSQDFTSKDQVSELSGRGVGLSAVKEEVKKLKGSIEIKTKILHGTTFIFYLPYNIAQKT